MKKGIIVEVKKPINNNLELTEILNSKLKYNVCYPKIKEINNAFVTYDGLVLKNFILVKGCAFNLKGKEDNTFYYQFWREAIEKFLVSKYGKSIPSIHLDSTQKYLLIHSKWFNYAFWINAFLPRLFQAIKLDSNIVLIAPESWKTIPFVMQTLEKIEIKKEWIPIDHQIFVKKLVLPETREWTSSFHPEIIKSTKNELIKLLNAKSDQEFPKKIYLTRAKRGNRCAANEGQVMEVLSRYGYKSITFEGLTIWEQIEMMSQATHFVSIHGAGLSNLMFMNKNTAVLEIINKTYASLEYTFPFWKLANCLDLNYFMLLSEPEEKSNFKLSFGKYILNNDENSYLVNSNLIIDMNEFSKIIHQMEAI